MKPFLRTALLGAAVFALLAVFTVPPAFAAVAGTMSRWVGNLLTFDGSSGNDAFSFDVNGLRGHFGTGTDDYIASNGTNLIVGTSPGAGYVASAIPVSIGTAYVNNVIAAVTYGGGTLPAHAATVTDIAYDIRTQGTGGSSNNVLTVSDGTNTCTCSFACNQATGAQIASCVNGAGTGCVYAASAALTYAFTATGNCTGKTDILGNIEVRGKWQ